jgi:hypothetical protein
MTNIVLPSKRTDSGEYGRDVEPSAAIGELILRISFLHHKNNFELAILIILAACEAKFWYN